MFKIFWRNEVKTESGRMKEIKPENLKKYICKRHLTLAPSGDPVRNIKYTKFCKLFSVKSF